MNRYNNLLHGSAKSARPVSNTLGFKKYKSKGEQRMNKSTFRRTKLAVLAMLLWSTVSVADEGPFGITWGMSKSQVKALGVDMEPSSAKLSC